MAGGLAAAQDPERLTPLPDPTSPGPAPAPVPMKKSSFQHKATTPPLPASLPDLVEVRQAQAFGPPRGTAIGLGNEQMDYLIQLLPASYERLIRLQSEDALREQIRQENRETERPGKAIFPEEKSPTEETYTPRQFAPQVTLAEPNYVNYKRLYFQDLNTERYGWELGFAQPFASAALFFADLALVPYHFASRPCDCVETGSGYCQKDDPVPLLLYPPDLSSTGALGEAAAIIGLIAIFP